MTMASYHIYIISKIFLTFNRGTLLLITKTIIFKHCWLDVLVLKRHHQAVKTPHTRHALLSRLES